MIVGSLITSPTVAARGLRTLAFTKVLPGGLLVGDCHLTFALRVQADWLPVDLPCAVGASDRQLQVVSD